MTSIKTYYNGTLFDTVSYTYDNAGNITELNDYAGNSFEYEYDGANRLTGITKGGSAAAAYEYTAAGELARVTTPEGKMSYTYDNASRLLTQTNTLADNTQINNYSYTYDILGNQIQKTDTSNGSTLSKITGGQTDESVVQYTYNELNQLTRYTAADGTVTSYGYDGTGMRVTKTQGDKTHRLVSDAWIKKFKKVMRKWLETQWFYISLMAVSRTIWRDDFEESKKGL